MAIKLAASLGALNSGQSSSQLVRTSGGNLYAVLVVSSTIKIYRSTNSGVSWSIQDYSNSPSTLGTFVAAAIDGTDKIHMAFRKQAVVNILEYATFSTSTNTFGPSEDIQASQVNPATGAAIAIDSNNQPHVAYADSGNGKYYNRIGKSGQVWNSAALGAFSTSNLDIQLDLNNIPWISYIDNTTPALRVATGNRNNASSFTSTAVVASGAFTTGAGTSIAIDVFNNIWLGYQSAQNGPIQLVKHIATDATGTWQTALTSGSRGFNVSLAGDPSNIYIFYERNLGGIAYDRYDTVNAKWLGETILQSALPAFRPHNPFVKWSQYFNTGDTAANNTNQQTIEYLFDDGSTIYYDKLITAQISTGLASISFSTPPATTTTSTSSTSSSTSVSTSTSSTSSSTSTSISTSSTSSSSSISTSSTSQSTSTSLSTSSTSQSTSLSTSTSHSTSSTSQSTSTSLSTSSTSQSTSTSSTSSSISTSSTSSSTSISTSSTSSSISTSTSLSTSSTSQSTSTSLSTSSTSSSTSLSTSSTSSSTSLSTSSTSSSTSASTSSTSASSSTSTSVTGTTTSTSSTSSSTSISTSSTSSSTSTTMIDINFRPRASIKVDNFYVSTSDSAKMRVRNIQSRLR